MSMPQVQLPCKIPIAHTRLKYGHHLSKEPDYMHLFYRRRLDGAQHRTGSKERMWVEETLPLFDTCCLHRMQVPNKNWSVIEVNPI